MFNSLPFSRTIFFSITYILSIIIFSAMMGYLIAICPCNKDIGTGILYAVFSYALIVISIIFHYHKIVGIRVGHSILWTFLVSIVAIFIIVWIEFNSYRRFGIDYHHTILHNYFLQWFVTGTSFSAIHGIAMFIMVMLKEARKIPK